MAVPETTIGGQCELSFAPADSTTYHGASNFAWRSTGATNDSRIVCPLTGTITRFSILTHVNGTLGTSESVTLTLEQNGTNTALAVTQTWNAANVAIATDTDSISVAEGDTLGLELVTPAWTTNPTDVYVQWQLQIEGTAGQAGWWQQCLGLASPADSTTYYLANNTSNPATGAGATQRVLCPISGIIEKVFLYTRINGTLGSAQDVTYVFQINGTDTSATATQDWDVADVALTTINASLPVNAGDKLGLEVTTPVWAPNPTAWRQQWGVQIKT